jgi:parallel beta-helix repeat protein
MVVSPGLHVGKASCSDSGPGTKARPFCTIGKAAAVVAAGDVVEVAAGSYREKVNVPRSGTSRAPIVFKAAPRATVTVLGLEHGFEISGRSWITITGFNVTDTVSYGIKVSSSSSITLSNNHVSNAGEPAQGQAQSGIYAQNVADSVISGNTVDHNSSYGIYLLSSARNQVRGNIVFSNAQGFRRAASGIRLYGSTGNTISSNISHHNEDSGIEAYASSHDNLIVNNDAYLNGDHGIDLLGSKTNRVVSNTVYDNVTAGINVEGGSTGATMRNNICINDGLDSPRTNSNIRVDAASVSDTTLNRDLVYLSRPGIMIIWGATRYTSLAAFRTATGQEAQGIEADPKFADPAAGNFRLLAGSPAIDSADSGANGQQTTDIEGKGRVDDPATANTGAGPRAYDDRGAHELVAR